MGNEIVQGRVLVVPRFATSAFRRDQSGCHAVDTQRRSPKSENVSRASIGRLKPAPREALRLLFLGRLASFTRLRRADLPRFRGLVWKRQRADLKVSTSIIERISRSFPFSFGIPSTTEPNRLASIRAQQHPSPSLKNVATSIKISFYITSECQPNWVRFVVSASLIERRLIAV